jgi:hypothetical protein
MKSLKTAALILTFSLCAPAAVYATDSASPVHKAHAYHRVAQATIPNDATALSPTFLHEPETDGLSRNHDECNNGCIDN